MNSASARVIRLLLIDAVDWSEAYPANHRLRNVPFWFGRHFTGDPSVDVQTITSHSAIQEGLADGSDGVIMSGSPRDAWASDTFTERMIELIRKIHANAVPFLGVCYGHQLLGRVFGGKVGPQSCGLELGTGTIHLTDAGRRSPLFEGLPSTFEVLQSHCDAVLELPPDAELLASGEKVAIQAFQIGRLMFGVQFHPEMDPDVVRFLWEPRREKWKAKVSFDLDRTLEGMSPTPTAPTVLKNFVTLCRSQAR